MTDGSANISISRSSLRTWTAVLQRFTALDAVHKPRQPASGSAHSVPRPTHRTHILALERQLPLVARCNPSASAAAAPSAPARRALAAAAPSLAVSVLRPRVPAKGRFSAWTSVFAIAQDARNPRVVSLAAREARAEAILASVETSTLGTYSSGLLRFHEFCDAHRVPESERMPASDFLLSAFVAHHTGHVSKSCIDNWTAGLQLWHNIHDAPWRGSRGLTAVTKAVKKHAPAASSRARRPPVTVEHLRCLERHLDLADSFDAAVYAAASIAFHGCCRLGEVVVPSESAFRPDRHISRACPIKRGTGRSGVRFCSIRLPWSKTAGTQGADVVLTASNNSSCPISSFDNHLRVNADAPSDGALFSWKAVDGSWHALSREWLMRRCAAIWSVHGLAAVQGHSFRIGGATELLLRGVEPAVVAMQGRWTSRAFLQYWRNVEVILPDFISRASPTVSIQSISNAVARLEGDIV